jgi:CO dehydrogenase maturation factor
VRGIIRELGADGPAGADVTILDLEAGLENLKRGTPRHIDSLVVVAEPYFRALETAVRTAELAQELGIPSVGIVANKVRDERDEQSVRTVFESRDLAVLAVVPFDPAVVEADRVPAALIDVAPDAPAVRAIEDLVSALGVDGDGSEA